MNRITFRILFFLLLAIVSALLGVSCAHTSEVKDSNGNPIALAVDSREKVAVNGSNQWMYLAGAQRDNPVLLWLDGGPGGSEVAWVRHYLGPLHTSFTVVCWDQRGTAGSFHTDKDTLTVEQFVDDVIVLSEMLAKRFGQEKIFLVGHSWGSVIGLLAAQKRPDLYHAYIGAAQHINSIENDTIGWRMILEGARTEGDEKTVKLMEKMGPPPYTKLDKDGSPVGDGDAYYQVLKRLYHYSPSAPADRGFDSMKLFLAPEHSLWARINLVRGLLRGIKVVYPQLAFLDMEDMVTSIECPLLLVNGRYDMTCVASISERWFLEVNAPSKQLLWLENSGHNGVFTEPEQFIEFLMLETRLLISQI